MADIKNSSKDAKGGGTITAGLFLQEFIKEPTKWAHLDIAGVAWKDKGDNPGPQGWGVATLARYVMEQDKLFS